MSTRKKIPTNLLDKIQPQDRALFLELWLTSDKCGIVPNTYPLDQLQGLHESKLIKVTKNVIVLLDYLSANYGTIKPDHNPHKAALSCIESNGFVFNYDNQMIDIPLSQQISDFSVLDVDQKDQSRVSGATQKDNSLEPLKMDQAESAANEPRIIQIVKSTNFALILAMLLLLCQSVHTSHTLLDLSGLPTIANYPFAICSALLLDGLLIYFVAIGDVRNSFIFFLISSLLNIYSYHIGLDSYWTYQSLFCFIPAIGIPFAVHSVSSKLRLVNS